MKPVKVGFAKDKTKRGLVRHLQLHLAATIEVSNNHPPSSPPTPSQMSPPLRRSLPPLFVALEIDLDCPFFCFFAICDYIRLSVLKKANIFFLTREVIRAVVSLMNEQETLSETSND